MEEFNTRTPSNSESDTAKESEGLAEKLSKPITRRSFLKGLGLVLAAGTLAACGPKGILEADNEEENFDENIHELNKQFDLVEGSFLGDGGFFNYGRFSDQYPGFENYKDVVEANAIYISQKYRVHPNAMRALASSIVVANMNNQDPRSVGNQFEQRIGVMQFVPIHLFQTDRIKKDPKFPMSVEELSEPEANIKYGLQYLVEGLRDFKNDGQNKNVMELMLAQYYGKDSLLDDIKWNREITEESSLWSNYVKYKNTLNVLGISSEGVKSNESVSMEQVWRKVEDLWSGSRFKENKDVFFLQAQSYFGDKANKRLKVSQEGYLALFASIARAESRGGKVLYNVDSGACGWYQLVPSAGHLEDFNRDFGTNYKYEDFRNVDEVDRHDSSSIVAGIWALMRYRNTIDELRKLAYKDDPDMHVLMKFFKAGRLFGKNRDDALWWNRVAYGIKSLLGQNPFNMEYMEYYAPRKILDANGKVIDTVWKGPFEASKFEELGDFGIMSEDPK